MDVKTYRVYVAELVGTFLIVFLSGAACARLPMDPETGQPQVEPWAIVLVALAAGAAVAVVLPITFRESPGCLNPALTLTFWICKRLDTQKMGILVGVQLLGSLLAGLSLRVIFPEQAIAFATPHVGKTLLEQTGNSVAVILMGGVAVEAVLTFFLTFAVFGFLIDRRTNRLGGALVGVAQGRAGARWLHTDRRQRQSGALVRPLCVAVQRRTTAHPVVQVRPPRLLGRSDPWRRRGRFAPIRPISCRPTRRKEKSDERADTRRSAAVGRVRRSPPRLPRSAWSLSRSVSPGARRPASHATVREPPDDLVSSARSAAHPASPSRPVLCRKWIFLIAFCPAAITWPRHCFSPLKTNRS